MLKISGLLHVIFLNQVFINLFKIWLIITVYPSELCVVWIQNFRWRWGWQWDLSFLHTDLWGKIVSTEIGLYWWEVCLFLLRGTVCLSRNRIDRHLAPYVRSRMFTPELSGSIFPMYSNDDLVPHCGCHPGLLPDWPVYPALGKSQFHSVCLQELSHVHPWNSPLWRFNQIKPAFSASFLFFNVNSSHTNTIKFDQVRQAQEQPFCINSIWVTEKSDLTFCYIWSTHIISTGGRFLLLWFGESLIVRWS